MDPDPQHWLGESDPAGVICTVMDGPYILSCRIVPVAPDRSCPAAQLMDFQLLLYSNSSLVLI
jgi:hypothetical protein